MYRVGGKQPRNIYRVTDEHPEGEYIGVFFDEKDAAKAVSAMNTELVRDSGLGAIFTVPGWCAPSEVTYGSDAV